MIYQGDAYRSFENWIDNLEPIVAKNFSYHEYFEPDKLFLRIKQVIIEKVSKEYLENLIKPNKLPKSKYGPLIISNEVLKISLKKRILYNLFFLLESLYLLITFFWRISKKSNQNSRKYKILIEPPIVGSIKSFKKFLEENRIEGLENSDELIIKKSNSPRNTIINTKFFKNPWIEIINYNLGFLPKVKLIFDFILYTLSSIIYLNKSNLNILLYRDLPNSFFINFLNKRKEIKDIFVTNSFLRQQPLWLDGLKSRSFKTHMIWYSQNIIPKFYKGESSQSIFPGVNMIRIDNHWVWTKKFGEYISNLNRDSNFSFVGPILFYNPEHKMKSFEKKTISIFDVIPIKDYGYTGSFKNYYTVETISNFVGNILLVVNKIREEYSIDIEVVLKSKRRMDSRYHDLQYFDNLDKYLEKFGFFKVIQDTTNLYDLIKNSMMIFSVPFTSTAEVGKELEIPSFYYDSSAKIRPNKKIYEIPFLESKNEISKEIVKILNVNTK